MEKNTCERFYQTVTDLKPNPKNLGLGLGCYLEFQPFQAAQDWFRQQKKLPWKKKGKETSDFKLVQYFWSHFQRWRWEILFMGFEVTECFDWKMNYGYYIKCA